MPCFLIRLYNFYLNIVYKTLKIVVLSILWKQCRRYKANKEGIKSFTKRFC